MYGEIKGRVVVRIPEDASPEQDVRLEVEAPELARLRYHGKILVAKRTSIRPLSATHGMLQETDILAVEG